jgi:processive 1,2-diacylglycerol beta-glucosyltransferase
MAGSNEKLLGQLQQLAAHYGGRLVPQAYTQQVERLMACSDLVITKPGGLTTAECLAMGLPMIVNDPVPGQEEGNANYLLESGVALKASDWPTLSHRVRHLMDHPEKLAEMRGKARALARPHAARSVIDTVMGKV